MPWEKGQTGNPSGRPRVYATPEEREAAAAEAHARAKLNYAARLRASTDMARQTAFDRIADMPPVSIGDALDPAELERAMHVDASHDTLLHLGRLGERVALAKLIETVLDESTDPKIRAANMRALLQGWSSAPKQSINLQINTEKLDTSELIELGRQMFAPPAIDITPAGAEPRVLKVLSPSESKAE